MVVQIKGVNLMPFDLKYRHFSPTAFLIIRSAKRTTHLPVSQNLPVRDLQNKCRFQGRFLRRGERYKHILLPARG